jgi:hypothetical protein
VLSEQNTEPKEMRPFTALDTESEDLYTPIGSPMSPPPALL